ncbi:MAG: hypothetical protein WA957_15385 [Alteraurantiacibacter sp.]
MIVAGLPFTIRQLEIFASLSETGSYVMSAMLERGVAVACFSRTMLRQEAREHVIELRPLTQWRLLLFRRPAPPDPRRDAVEQFLIETTLGNPDFSVIKVLDETYRPV